MADYPEHDKLAEVKDDSQALGFLLQRLPSLGYHLAQSQRIHRDGCALWGDDEAECDCESYDKLLPVSLGDRTINEILGKLYDIDLVKLADEKEAMYQALRATA